VQILSNFHSHRSGSSFSSRNSASIDIACIKRLGRRVAPLDRCKTARSPFKNTQRVATKDFRALRPFLARSSREDPPRMVKSASSTSSSSIDEVTLSTRSSKPRAFAWLALKDDCSLGLRSGTFKTASYRATRSQI